MIACNVDLVACRTTDHRHVTITAAMIPELGHFALIVALCIAVVQAFVPLIGSFRGNAAWMEVARPAAAGQFVFVAIAFGCLAWSFVGNDFSVLNVASNSNSSLPVHYRFAATWGSHEGSLLLWVLMLTVWTLAVTVFSRQLPPQTAGARALGHGDDQRGLPRVHAVHLQPVRAPAARRAPTGAT